MAKIQPSSLEFRQEAVRLLRTSGRLIPQFADDLGVSPQSLRNWARQLAVDEGDLHPECRTPARTRISATTA